MTHVLTRSRRARPMARRVRPALHRVASPRLRSHVYRQPSTTPTNLLVTVLLTLACIAAIAFFMLAVFLARLWLGEHLGALHLRGF